MTKEIESKVRNILAESITLNMPIDEIGLEVDLSEVGLDSASSIKVVVGIEAEFAFQFEDEDLISDNFKTIKSLVSYVEERINNVQ